MTKEERKLYMKFWKETHKDYEKKKKKLWLKNNPEYMITYNKADVNSFGKTKNNIRSKSNHILNKMNLKIPDYEIHHCFGYDDENKFIYISKSLHLKIHQYLRDNNIDADTNHWMQIRDIVNDTDEFTYIKC